MTHKFARHDTFVPPRATGRYYQGEVLLSLERERIFCYNKTRPESCQDELRIRTDPSVHIFLCNDSPLYSVFAFVNRSSIDVTNIWSGLWWLQVPLLIWVWSSIMMVRNMLFAIIHLAFLLKLLRSVFFVLFDSFLGMPSLKEEEAHILCIN